MPVQDDDGVFLVAVIARFGSHLAESEVDLHKSKLLLSLASGDLMPIVGYVRPVPGYADALMKRMDKMNTMARITRLMTGGNAEYLTNDGFRVRNHIWSVTMAQMLGQVVLSALMRGPVTEVQIYLDQKTLAEPARKFFSDQVRGMEQILRQTIANAKSVVPAVGNVLDLRAAFDSRKIFMQWSDESACLGAEHGLLVAHHLASNVRREISAASFDASVDVFGGSLIDMTDEMVRPLHDKAVDRWKRSTGLAEPE